MFRQYDAIADLLLPTEFIPKEKPAIKEKAKPNRNRNSISRNDVWKTPVLICCAKALSAEEAKLFRKIVKEWCDGDENSFPVQLALLTRAQWQAAALIPQAIKDSGKLIEFHLAECRRHVSAIVKNLSTVADLNAVELKGIIKTHTETVNQASVDARNRLWETEEVAKRITGQLNSGFSEWKKAKDNFAAERLNLEKERKELGDTFAVEGFDFCRGNLLWSHRGRGCCLNTICNIETAN